MSDKSWGMGLCLPWGMIVTSVVWMVGAPSHLAAQGLVETSHPPCISVAAEGPRSFTSPDGSLDLEGCVSLEDSALVGHVRGAFFEGQMPEGCPFDTEIDDLLIQIEDDIFDLALPEALQGLEHARLALSCPGATAPSPRQIAQVLFLQGAVLQPQLPGDPIPLEMTHFFRQALAINPTHPPPQDYKSSVQEVWNEARADVQGLGTVEPPTWEAVTGLQLLVDGQPFTAEIPIGLHLVQVVDAEGGEILTSRFVELGEEPWPPQSFTPPDGASIAEAFVAEALGGELGAWCQLAQEHLPGYIWLVPQPEGPWVALTLGEDGWQRLNDQLMPRVSPGGGSGGEGPPAEGRPSSNGGSDDPASQGLDGVHFDFDARGRPPRLMIALATTSAITTLTWAGLFRHVSTTDMTLAEAEKAAWLLPVGNTAAAVAWASGGGALLAFLLNRKDQERPRPTSTLANVYVSPTLGGALIGVEVRR